MIVYGDASFCQRSSRLVYRLGRQCAGGLNSAESLRTWLILSGEVEQAVADGRMERERADIEWVTDCAADALLVPEQGQVLRANALSMLSRTATTADPLLTVKIPEGYAVYALYPERYVRAAEAWAASQPRRGCAAVVGIRSIGTSLSAIVAARLRQLGWKTRRWTVRPGGHPFARQVAIDPRQVRGVDRAIVVDEGPGMSGSSMVAVAKALVESGLNETRITFFPGHAHPPGAVASDEVRRWWDRIPRSVAPFEPEWLRAGEGAADNLSAGAWRSIVYADPERWPAVCAAFERRKLLLRRPDGQEFFCKFVGLAAGPDEDSSAQGACRRWERLAERGWSVPVTEIRDGFLIRPWIQGRPLTLDDANRLPPETLGRYIADAAGPPLSRDEQRAAVQRLEQMLIHNIQEAFGRSPSIQVPESGASEASAGDGRLGPQDWILTPSGQILKADCGGHDLDHTIVGRQPVAWDIAGATIEWQMPEERIPALLAACPPVSPGTLRFYRLAYAAFRLGQCRLCASLDGDPSERERLTRAERFYGSSIESMLFTQRTQGP